MPFVVNNLAMYIVNPAPAAAGAAAAADALQQGAGGTAGFLAVLAIGSKIIGKVVAVNAGPPATYDVQFGPVGNEGEPVVAANLSLQVLNIPEAQLQKISMLNNITVAGVAGGSRKRRRSKKRKNQRKHHNNQ
jgi:hypothetical protein